MYVTKNTEETSKQKYIMPTANSHKKKIFSFRGSSSRRSSYYTVKVYCTTVLARAASKRKHRPLERRPFSKLQYIYLHLSQFTITHTQDYFCIFLHREINKLEHNRKS